MGGEALPYKIFKMQHCRSFMSRRLVQLESQGASGPELINFGSKTFMSVNRVKSGNPLRALSFFCFLFFFDARCNPVDAVSQEFHRFSPCHVYVLEFRFSLALCRNGRDLVVYVGRPAK